MSDPVLREVLLSFWKVHILHHAREQPVYGHWMLLELRKHGFRLSPGTLYPLLARMEGHGWLRARKEPGAGKKARRYYRLTPKGKRVLKLIRRQVDEMHREVVLGVEPRH